jgi:transposase-like protein
MIESPFSKKEGYAMREDTVVQLRQPGTISEDPLTEVLRIGARRLLAQAVEMEVTAFVEAHGHLSDEAGRRRIVRHGHLPEREIQTGIGPVAVRCPRVRDRQGSGSEGPIRFSSAILPRYLRRTKSIEELLPWLYLKGISTGDFSEALAALLGPEAPGLSASTIARLKEVWQGELEHWQKRDLSARRYVYFWADGVYFSPRLDQDKQGILVIIGADELGRKELLAIADGYRESAQSWREVLLDLKRRGLAIAPERRGLAIAPELATGDGALGFWKALREVYGQVREQRCWVGSLKKSAVAEPVRTIRRSQSTGSQFRDCRRDGSMAGLYLRPAPSRWHRTSLEERPRAA